MWNSRAFALILFSFTTISCSLEGPSDSNKKSSTDFEVSSAKVNSSVIDATTEYPEKTQFEFLICLEESSRNERLAKIPFHIFDGEEHFSTFSDNQGCIIHKKTFIYSYSAIDTYIPYDIKISGPQNLRGSLKIPFALNPWVAAKRLSKRDHYDLRPEKSAGDIPYIAPKGKIKDVLAGNFKTPKNVNRGVNFHFRTLSLKYGGLEVDNETSTSRTVKILVTACVTDNIYFTPLRGRKFSLHTRLRETERFRARSTSTTTSNGGAVRLEGTKKSYVTTDHMGCVRFTDRLSHKIYKPERFYIKDYYLEDLASEEVFKLSAAVNPWNTGWLFARDLREVNIDEINEVSNQRPKLFVSSYSLQARGTEYEIDDYLRLNIKRKYIFRMVPEVIRHDSLAHGRFGNQKLKDGIYYLRLALVRDFNEEIVTPERYVNSWEQLVRVSAGVVVTPIYFDIQDLTLMGSRARMVIQLLTIREKLVKYFPSPYGTSLSEQVIDQAKSLRNPNIIDYNSGLIQKTYTGPFIPKFESQGPSLVESPISAEVLIARGREHREKIENEYKKHHSLANYDKRSRLNNFDLNKENDDNWFSLNHPIFGNQQESIKRFIDDLEVNETMAANLGRRFCTFWFLKHIPNIIRDSNSSNKKQVADAYLKSSNLLHSLCQTHEVKNDSFFSFDHIVKINKLSPKRVKYLGGTSFNLNVGAGFSLTKSEGWDVNNGFSSSEGFSASAGADLLSFMSIKANKSATWTASEGYGNKMGRGANINYGAGAYLVVQHSIFRIMADDYQKCMNVKPKFKLFKALIESKVFKEESGLYDRLKSYLKPDDLADKEQIEALREIYDSELLLSIMDSGIRFCSDPQAENPLSFTENYFYITQHFTTGDLHDPADLLNRPWLMSIRGVRDFRVFTESILNHNQLKDVGSHRANLPIDILSEAYVEYNNKQPSWPGIYSFTKYDPRKDVSCNANRNMVDDLISEAKDLLVGPRGKMNGNSVFDQGFDFWSIYYCPQNAIN